MPELLWSLPDLSDRSEPRGIARENFHDFAAHSETMQKKSGKYESLLPLVQ